MCNNQIVYLEMHHSFSVLNITQYKCSVELPFVFTVYVLKDYCFFCVATVCNLIDPLRICSENKINLNLF